jgi:hypothetical protein
MCADARVCCGLPDIAYSGVLWGYFIFMSVKSLEGSQLWERLLLLGTDPRKRVAVLQQEHAAYMQVSLMADKLGCTGNMVVLEHGWVSV